MLPLIKRQAVRLLRQAGRSQADVARLTGVSRRQIQRIDVEPPAPSLSDREERKRRGIGRPSKTAAFAVLVMKELRANPAQTSSRIMGRAVVAGYAGSRSAMYALIARIRESMRDGVPESVRDRAPESVRDRVPESVRDRAPESVRDRVPESVRGMVPESSRGVARPSS